MRLQVIFGHHVNAVVITHTVPGQLVRVVAGPDGIDVIFFKGLNILFHVGHRDGTAPLVIPFVAVDPVDNQPFAVQQDDMVRADFNPPEAKPVWDQLN